MAKYIGLRFRQSDSPKSPYLVTFVAEAREIRSWAGVPHKTGNFLGGFQRPLSSRYQQLIEFFEEEGNVSPTSIVVAFQSGRVSVSSIDVKAIQHEELQKVVEDQAYMPDFVVIDIDEGAVLDSSLPELADATYKSLIPRVEKDKLSDDDGGSSDADGDDPEDAGGADEEVQAEGAAQTDWGVDVGKSALRDFANEIKDEESLEALVSTMASQADDDDPEKRRQQAEQTLREALLSLQLPGVIVDGQHRVWGASECDHRVPLTVCALVDVGWEEAVFQFVVVNKQARAISGELLASIVNSSLTNFEIGELEDKLEAAGISTYETRILRILNDDPDSPFQGLISKGVQEEGQKKITFKAAIALAGRWKKRMNNRDDAFKTLFRPGLNGDSNAQKQATWDEEWKSYMFAFWNGVKKLFQKEQLWEPGTQLMYRATLETLQDNFLKVRTVSGEAIDSPVRLRESVEQFYQNVPAGFFHTEWKRKELLTEDGRKVLANALNSMRVPGKKLASLRSKDPLFTGESTKGKPK